MSKLQVLLDSFRSDSDWNTQNKDGTHRFDEKIAWIESMVNDYAEKLGRAPDQIIELMEAGRTYSWPNYYQEANFPGLDDDSVIGVYDTFEQFREAANREWIGFRCPKCGTVSPHPQYCKHRLDKDGVCDWCSFGLFKTRRGVIILECGVNLIHIFEPVPKDRVERKRRK